MIAGQSKEPFFDPQRRLGHICTLDGRSFSVFGAMRCAGKCVNWAQKLFEVGSPRAFDAAASNIPAGADGLIFLPYLEGERSPVYDEQAQGVFFGMTQQHRREHFLRAVLEGVGCGLSQILDVLRERGEILDLRIIGGGAKSKVWKQIIADLCEVRLHDVTTLSDSAATLGAAAAAGVGIGLFDSLSQAVSCIAQASVLSPEEETYPAYRALRARYDLLYRRLRRVPSEIKIPPVRSCAGLTGGFSASSVYRCACSQSQITSAAGLAVDSCMAFRMEERRASSCASESARLAISSGVSVVTAMPARRK